VVKVVTAAAAEVHIAKTMRGTQQATVSTMPSFCGYRVGSHLCYLTILGERLSEGSFFTLFVVATTIA
jgi:hypothetical protein